MNFYIDQSYDQAIRAFVWPLEVDCVEIPSVLDADLEEITNEIAKKIIGASQVRPRLEIMCGHDIPLRSVCLIVAKEIDIKNKIMTTVIEIENATIEEKTVLQRVFRKLSEMFVQFEEGDLKAETLVFGIHRVHLLASGFIVLTQQLSQEEALNKLVVMQNQYNRNDLKGPSLEFMNDVDQCIVNNQPQQQREGTSGETI